MTYFTKVPENPEVPISQMLNHNEPVRVETVFREPKKGIINTEAEDSVLSEEFLPKVEPGLRDDVRQCFIGSGHFVLGRHCTVKGENYNFVSIYNSYFI